jgi:hypothetical protein
MRSRVGVVIAICLGGCAGAAGDPDGAHEPTQAIWGIVPNPPARKADLRPAMIRGTAVAVTENVLLAACAATLGREQVGLVRHNKLRLAQVTRDEGSQICRLTRIAPIRLAQHALDVVSACRLERCDHGPAGLPVQPGGVPGPVRVRCGVSALPYGLPLAGRVLLPGVRRRRQLPSGDP